jgi:ethanolamine ammonia-lyase small subunit
MARAEPLRFSAVVPRSEPFGPKDGRVVRRPVRFNRDAHFDWKTAVNDGEVQKLADLTDIGHPFWATLRAATSARVGLRRTGSSLATSALLDFQFAHARARDAVHAPMPVGKIADGLRRRALHPLLLQSAASDRQAYLARPDLGRRLNVASRIRLGDIEHGYDVAFVIADGLSALAAERHALPMLDLLLPRFHGWRVGPLSLVEQGRVAIGDEIGQLLRASLVVILIGERPGLSAHDSLGAYVTFAPAIGRSDAERNCLSNIRRDGMPYGEASERLLRLCAEARRRGQTGVRLKDDMAFSAAFGSELQEKPVS